MDEDEDVPSHLKTRAISRAGILACARYFEAHLCPFQEINQQNDFGKDAYVDLTPTGDAEGHCVALQIKSGASYRRASGEYHIPIGNHARSWRESTLPVFGVVADPERDCLAWVDLTGYLREHASVKSGSVVIPKKQRLTDATFDLFRRAVAAYHRSNDDQLCLRMLSCDADLQAQALNDAWALGRRDVRYLLLCRRVLLELPRPATRWWMWRMSHAANHPDIFFTSKNWLPVAIQERLRQSFRWSVSEIVHCIRAIDPLGEQGRGNLGQCLDSLLRIDPGFLRHLPDATHALLDAGDQEAAVGLTAMALGQSQDPSAVLREQFRRFPALTADATLQEVALCLREVNSFTLY